MRIHVLCLLLLAACGGSVGGGAPNPGFDAGSGFAFDMHQGRASDLALGGGGAPDLGTAPVSDGGLRRFGCASDFNCYVANRCADAPCLAACDAQVNTPEGLRLLHDYLDCLYVMACPNTGGGVCDPASDGYQKDGGAACVKCVQAAKASTCKPPATSCGNDG